jgi:hypothetical protein
MKIKQTSFNIFKLIFVDLILEIIYFPFWWYSSGLYRTGAFSLKQIAQQWNNMGMGIHFKFLFKPMYAQRDFSGRVISFFARFIQLIFKLVVFLILILIFLALFLLWIILPIIIIWQIKLNYEFIRNVG